MKKELLFLLNLIVILFAFSCNAQSDKGEVSMHQSQADMVEVYYFHFTQRCVTCQAVENETKKAIEELYTEALKEEKIVFISFNLDNEEGKKMAEKLNIAGQTLLVVKDNKQMNLTNDGFLYARTNPEKLREAIQQAVGKI